jgi:hypothetical protein
MSAALSSSTWSSSSCHSMALLHPAALPERLSASSDEREASRRSPRLRVAARGAKEFQRLEAIAIRRGNTSKLHRVVLAHMMPFWRPIWPPGRSFYERQSADRLWKVESVCVAAANVLEYFMFSLHHANAARKEMRGPARAESTHARDTTNSWGLRVRDDDFVFRLLPLKYFKNPIFYNCTLRAPRLFNSLISDQPLPSQPVRNRKA